MSATITNTRCFLTSNDGEAANAPDVIRSRRKWKWPNGRLNEARVPEARRVAHRRRSGGMPRLGPDLRRPPPPKAVSRRPRPFRIGDQPLSINFGMRGELQKAEVPALL